MLVPDSYAVVPNPNGQLCSRHCESLAEHSMSNGDPVKSLTYLKKGIYLSAL